MRNSIVTRDNATSDRWPEIKLQNDNQKKVSLYRAGLGIKKSEKKTKNNYRIQIQNSLEMYICSFNNVYTMLKQNKNKRQIRGTKYGLSNRIVLVHDVKLSWVCVEPLRNFDMVYVRSNIHIKCVVHNGFWGKVSTF